MKYYPFELHTHTIHSDGDFSVEQLVEYAKSRGLAGIAKTDHNTTEGNAKFAELCKEQGLIAVKGFEITNFSMGDATVLGQNASRYACTVAESEKCTGLKSFPVDRFSDVAENVIKRGGSIGYAHPYRYPPARTLGNFDEASGEERTKLTHIEVWNGPNIETGADYKDATKMYLKILQARPIAAIAGSDFHRPTSLGTVYPITYLGIENTPDSDKSEADKADKSDKAVGAILNRKTYISYGWKISDDDLLLGMIGGLVKSGRFEQSLAIDRLTPPLTGNYFENIIPYSVEIISCGEDGCEVSSPALFELSGDKMTARATLSAQLKPATRIVLRVHGFADGKAACLLITSPIEVL